MLLPLRLLACLCLSVSFFVCRSACLSVCMSVVCWTVSVCLSLHICLLVCFVYICLSVCQPARLALSARVFLSLPVFPSVHLAVCQLACMSVRLYLLVSQPVRPPPSSAGPGLPLPNASSPWEPRQEAHEHRIFTLKWLSGEGTGGRSDPRGLAAVRVRAPDPS